LPYVAAGQAQKHVTVNDAFARLDGLVQMAVETQTLASAPNAPQDGSLYILAQSPSGAAWSGYGAGSVMRFEAGSWSAFAVDEGTVAWLRDEDRLVVFDGQKWRSAGADLSIINNIQQLGVGTTADANNPVALRLNRLLLTSKPASDGGTGDLRQTLNKDLANSVLSMLFQSGWSGRAEFGLLGSEDFSLKVSADGGAWQTAFDVTRASGKVNFPKGSVRSQVDIFTTNGTYTIPAWAQRLEVILVGAGGGGASGTSGDATANRIGGGGGGAGGYVAETFDISELSGPLTVTVGSGGAGGLGVIGTSGLRSGAPGAASTLSVNGLVVLSANGGAGASSSSGAGGSGGMGSSGLGASGGASISTGVAGNGADGLGAGPGAGGGGGALDTASVQRSGGNGGQGHAIGGALRRALGGLGATSLGGAGTAGSNKAWARGTASGGGGGSASASSNGGAGGSGGVPGGGGGGGGACRTASTSGKGGDGGRGEVWIMAIG
jgi:hypothetical protein